MLLQLLKLLKLLYHKIILQYNFLQYIIIILYID